jgi:hypothetical protein
VEESERRSLRDYKRLFPGNNQKELEWKTLNKGVIFCELLPKCYPRKCLEGKVFICPKH